MNKEDPIYEALKSYFNNTPQEQLDAEWKEIKAMSNDNVLASDYIEFLKEKYNKMFNRAFLDLLVNGESEMMLPDPAVREEARRNMDNNMSTFGYTFTTFDGSECEGIINAKSKQEAMKKIKSLPDVDRLIDTWEE